MKLRYLQFAAVMLWGIQTGLMYFAVPMGIMLEARHFMNRRWALTRQDFYRVADLTSLAMVAVIVLLFLNRAHYHFITTLVQWLPILFFPLVIVLAFSTTERMPLDVLFYSLRRQRQPVTQFWDMNYVYFGLCFVSAGINTAHPRLYMIAVSILLLTALFRLRSPRYNPRIWVLLACAVFISAWFTQQGLRAGHLALKEKTREWLANYIHSRVNPLKTSSAIGSVGRLKLSDAIALRIAPQSNGTLPALLQEASYDIYSDNNWLALNPQFSTLPHEGDFVWRLAPRGPKEQHARIYLEFDADIDIVPVPANVTQIQDLPAVNVRESRYGALEGVGLVPSPGYKVSYRPGADVNTLPDSSDSFVPPNYRKLLARVAAGSSLPDTDPVARVRDILHDFHYSLYQDIPHASDPLAHFLLVSKAGHCEYFATATVLLLRYLGVPARYVVGYSVQEFDPRLDMYIVRERHAHAWAIAWIDHHWQVVDTTPAVWKTAEAIESNPFRPVLDFVSNETFVFQLWWSKQKLADYRLELYIAGALLLLILIWRIATSEQVTLETEHGPASDPRPGGNSPFFRIVAHLEERGLTRHPGEALSRWLIRIDCMELLPMLGLHNRLRFDPRGLGDPESAMLHDWVSNWLQAREEQSAN